MASLTATPIEAAFTIGSQLRLVFYMLLQLHITVHDIYLIPFDVYQWFCDSIPVGGVS